MLHYTDITLGFLTPTTTVSESNTLRLDIIFDINQLLCSNELLIVNLLLQLHDNQGKYWENYDSNYIYNYITGNIVNVSSIALNRYITKQSIDIDLDRLPLSLDFNTEGLLVTGRLIAMKETTIVIDQSDISVYNILSINNSTVTTDIQPTPTVIPLHEVLLNPALAYVIGGSSTILTGVICCYIIVGSFCCGRYCCQKKRHSLDTSGGEELHDRPGHYTVTSSPYKLANESTDIGTDQRARANSKRRPPPLPPSSRPLPPLPSQAEVYQNYHSESENKL